LCVKVGNAVRAYDRGQDLNTAEVPSMLNLSEAFPNPFNSTTTIAFSLTEQQQVSLQVFDLSGRLVETLVDGLVEAGSFSAVWNADMQSTGVYYYHIQVGSFQQTILMLNRTRSGVGYMVVGIARMESALQMVVIS
jgi:hypothetical protein